MSATTPHSLPSSRLSIWSWTSWRKNFFFARLSLGSCSTAAAARPTTAWGRTTTFTSALSCRKHWRCKSALQALGKKNAWVPDLVGNLLPACNGLKEKAVGLKHIMSADGVHFTKHGYEKLAETIVKCCKTQFEKSVSAASIVSARPAGTRQKTFYWRGFVSPVGSSRPASRTAAYLAAHPGGGGK